MQMPNISLSEKLNLTLKEASEYSGIGLNRLRKISDDNKELVLFIGNKRLIKRKVLEKFLEKSYSL